MAVALTLAVGDKFWLEDEPYAYTALKIQAGSGDGCFYVTTDLAEPPVLICAEDVAEILRRSNGRRTAAATAG